MKFLIDECVGRRLVVLLQRSGYDAVFVGDWKPSSSDEDVLRKAESEGRILITDDKDFGRLILKLKRPSTGVILIRTSTTDPNKRFDSLLKVLKKIDPSGKFIVIEDGAIRIKRIHKVRSGRKIP